MIQILFKPLFVDPLVELLTSSGGVTYFILEES